MVRQKIIQDKLLKRFAEEIGYIMSSLVAKDCDSVTTALLITLLKDVMKAKL